VLTVVKQRSQPTLAGDRQAGVGHDAQDRAVCARMCADTGSGSSRIVPGWMPAWPTYEQETSSRCGGWVALVNRQGISSTGSKSLSSAMLAVGPDRGSGHHHAAERL